jgi:hypothetical protein
MKTKDVLGQIANELEKTGALAIALQDRLISKGQLSEEEVATALPAMQDRYKKHLAALRFSISQLPE